jgi:hypothetical protein
MGNHACTNHGLVRYRDSQLYTLGNSADSSIGGFGMSDKFHLSLEQIDNGFIVRDRNSNVYFGKLLDAGTQLKVCVDALLKELTNPQAK